MGDRLQVRRDNASVWTSINPILSDGEFGFERDTSKLKIGNGVTAWNSLPYVSESTAAPYLALTGTAGEVLGGHRIVVDSLGSLYYASTTNLAHVNKVVGVTMNAVALGLSVAYVKDGLIVEPSWTWNTALPVYLGTNGLLTQTQNNTTGFTMIIGNPVSSTSLYVSLKTPILL